MKNEQNEESAIHIYKKPGESHMRLETIERLIISALFFASVIFSTGTFASADKLDEIRAAINKKGA